MTGMYMVQKEQRRVQEIYRLCHPTWKEHPSDYYLAHPTLVLHRDGEVVGFTSFSLSIAPNHELGSWGDDVMYGHDVCVDPRYQGKGYGLALCESRFDVCRNFGVKLFIGITWAGNKPMLAIFERTQCRRFCVIPNAYPTSYHLGEGIVYTKAIH